MFTVITFYHKYTNYWKELHRSKLPSPCKEYKVDKVWNVLSLTTGFWSKHIEKPGTDKEIVAVRKVPGVSFEEFYKNVPGFISNVKSQLMQRLQNQRLDSKSQKDKRNKNNSLVVHLNYKIRNVRNAGVLIEGMRRL